MIAYAIILRVLVSRQVRAGLLSAAGMTIRTVWGALRAPVTGGFIRGLWTGTRRFGGFLIKRIGALNLLGAALTFSALWGDIVSTYQFLWNFNWRSKDETLDAALKASARALATTLGATVGSALGYLVCGAVPGMTIATINEPLALYIFEELEEEAVDDIVGNIATLINQSAALIARGAFTFIFKNIRSLYYESSVTFRARLYSSGVIDRDKLDKAVAEREKPWSFALATEEFLEKSIPNEFLRDIVEETLEEFGESCIESGYIIAGKLDSFLAEARVTAGSVLGPERTVEILFNRTPTPTPGGTP